MRQTTTNQSEMNMNEHNDEQQNPDALIGLPVEHDGLLWTVAGHKRGWFELQHADGTTKKARRADFDPLEDEEEVAASAKMTSTLNKYRPKYTVSLAHSGKKSLNCGDRLAAVLSGMSYEDVYALTEYWCQLAVGSLRDRYAHLKNDGMRRMNAGNMLRRLVRRGQEGDEGRPAEFVAWLEDDEAVAKWVAENLGE